MAEGSLLLSIRPEYARKIFEGTKKVELRRKRPKLIESDWVLVYVSSPVKALIGAFQVKRVIAETPNQLWGLVRQEAGISRQEFMSYYEGSSVGYGIFLHAAKKFPTPIELNHLRELWSGFHPPQSYRYIRRTEIERIESFSKQIMI